MWKDEEHNGLQTWATYLATDQGLGHACMTGPVAPEALLEL